MNKSSNINSSNIDINPLYRLSGRKLAAFSFTATEMTLNQCMKMADESPVVRDELIGAIANKDTFDKMGEAFRTKCVAIVDQSPRREDLLFSETLVKELYSRHGLAVNGQKEALKAYVNVQCYDFISAQFDRLLNPI